MLKKKEVLFEDFKQFQCAAKDIYVGKIDDLKGEYFDTDNLCVAHLVHFVQDSQEFKKSDFRYVFEKCKCADVIFYKELFSGAMLERIDLKKALSSRGIYVFAPISYSDVANISSLLEEKTDGVVKRVRNQI